MNTAVFIAKNKPLVLYGLLMALLLLLLKWLEFRLVVADHLLELYTGAIATIFTALGIWLALKLARPKIAPVVMEKEIPADRANGFTVNECDAANLNISRREFDVLQLMAEGLSNQEIADRLFVSLNTVKTHASRVFEKLDVKRRTQAVEKAKRLKIIV